MNRNRYFVTEVGAAQGAILGRRVSTGQELWLTDGEAATPLERGFVASEAPEPVRNSIDHEVKGRKGGSLKRPQRRSH